VKGQGSLEKDPEVMGISNFSGWVLDKKKRTWKGRGIQNFTGYEVKGVPPFFLLSR